MNSPPSVIFQTLTLSEIPLTDWSRRSFFYRVTTLPSAWQAFFVQILSIPPAWQQRSWLLQQSTPWMLWAEPVALLLVSMIFVSAPFVSTTWIGLLLLAASGLWLGLGLMDPPGKGLTPMHLLVSLYWGIATIATAFSPVPKAALEGWIKLTLYLMFFGLLARLMRSPRIRSSLITVYLFTALIVSAYGIRQQFVGVEALATWVDPSSPLAETTRVYSYLGNPNLLASYLIPAVVFSLAAMFVWQSWGCKTLALFMTLINAACLVLTYSRGGWIGFVLSVFILAILLGYWWSPQWPAFWRTWGIPLAVGVLAACVVVAVVTVEPLRLRVESMVMVRSDSSNNFRMNVWAAVLQMIHDRPILGIGPGNDAFNQIYPLYQRPNFTALSAYSIFLELTVEAGLIGVSCFLWLLFVTFHQGWTHLQRLRFQVNPQGYWLMAAIASLVGILGHGLVDTVWYRPAISTLWWLAMAVVASYYHSSILSAETDLRSEQL
jgi:putative inorganic carbon (HCO3(-)) transporter